MKYNTNQQEAIDKVRNLSNHLVINAYAGTGKTTTLEGIIASYPNKRFIYLAYNASVKKEAEERFASYPNVKIVTTHGLAYRWYMQKYGRKPNVTFQFRAYTIRDQYDVDYMLASNVYKLLNYFCNSIHESLDDVSSLIKDPNFSSIYSQILQSKHSLHDVIDVTNMVIKDMALGKIQMIHDFYLKQAFLEDCHEYIDADIVLLDEAQDTNPVVYGILIKSNIPIVAVGDINQKIYGFRNAMNVMSDLQTTHNADIVYLVESFRFDQKIADLAYNVLSLKDFKGPKLIGKGPKNVKINKAFIARTNSVLIDRMAIHEELGTVFHTTKPASEIFSIPLAIYQEYFGGYVNVKINESIVKYIKSFKNLNDLEDFIKETKDVELSNALNLVKRYRSKLLSLYKLCNTYNRKRNKNGEILTTAHSAKGLEFNNVTIANDYKVDDAKVIFEKAKKGVAYSDSILNVAEEEVNVYYVALTRASKNLQFINDVSDDKNNIPFDGTTFIL